MRFVIIDDQRDEQTLAKAQAAAMRVFESVSATPLQSRIADWRIQYSQEHVSDREGLIGYAWLRAMAAVGNVLGKEAVDLRVEATQPEILDALRQLDVSQAGIEEFIRHNPP